MTGVENKATIQTLWIGDSLSTMEKLSLVSFLEQGHPAVLYSYREPAGVPGGIEVRDASEIIPENQVFTYDNGSPAAFANLFRYKLLFDKGGWWLDTDVVCVRPLPKMDHFYVAGEKGPAGLCNGIMYAPASDSICARLYGRALARGAKGLYWGETGAALIRSEVAEHMLAPPETFCPINYWDVKSIVRERNSPFLGRSTLAVHLWNEMWRTEGLDKDATYPSGSLYERLKSFVLENRNSNRSHES